MKFTEEKLEKAFAELLGQERFSRILGVTIVRVANKVSNRLFLHQYYR